MVSLARRYGVSHATISKIVHRLLKQERGGIIRE
jgi:Mor family transcriptional regulator